MITELESGTLINNRYQIQKLLGKGGFGRTYLALDNQRFDEPCVLKEFVPTASKAENLRKSQDLFEREAKVLYQIQHPQVPKFLAWFTDNQRIFIVQEYINGKTYSEIFSERLVQTGQPFSEIEVRTWLTDVLPVLDYLHERKIIHRDISLENIMLPDNQSKPVLIDFGTVKENYTQILSTDSLNFYNSIRISVVGKFGYSPPEQLRLGYSYPSSDIYALGVCTVILLTGKMPHALLDESLNWQWRSQINISDDFAKIIEKMLVEEPNARFQSAKEILLVLNNLDSSSSVLPRFEFKITSPTKAIKIRREKKETNKALEELLILQNLERNLRQSNNINENIGLEKPIYLNLDLSEYIKQKSSVNSESSTHALIKSSTIFTKINNFLTKITTKEVAENNDCNNKIYIQLNIHKFLENYSVTSNLQLFELIKKEYTNFVGPIAQLIINNVLVSFSDCSTKQIIEMLAAEIPEKLMAEQFQKHMYKIIESKLYILQTTE
ncbi:serine/threonine-protein kinase [Nostoc sp.]|uniref:non-specific serine/threonine protein kinase n=1 Tax=Nostoc punctiforme NIES-2108 TaxID=1356359 RepID=A0A367R5E3_NOSPU|nr:serine/threonine protein kinase [Nostoc punctiforme NIES-2108]